jgi:hypothetical protein
MSKVIQEVEGPWEEVRKRDADLKGKLVRLQIMEREPREFPDKLRSLLKETQAQARPVTDDEIDEEVRLVRAGRRCA